MRQRAVNGPGHVEQYAIDEPVLDGETWTDAGLDGDLGPDTPLGDV